MSCPFQGKWIGHYKSLTITRTDYNLNCRFINPILRVGRVLSSELNVPSVYPSKSNWQKLISKNRRLITVDPAEYLGSYFTLPAGPHFFAYHSNP